MSHSGGRIQKGEKEKMKRKMILAFAGLFIALSLVGATYAAWWDVIVIEGTANTGEFAVGLLGYDLWESTNGQLEDGSGDIPIPIPLKTIEGPWVTGPFVPKDVADTTVLLLEPEIVECTCSDGEIKIAHGMDIAITNAYPQYDAHIQFTYKNAGTIPAQFVGSEMYGLQVDDNGDWVYDGTNWVWHGWLMNPVGSQYPYAAEIYAYFEGPESGQLHPCTTYTGSIHIKFLQTAEECEIYDFGVMFKFVQWNKWYEEPILPWPAFPV